jgi:hypothetical protein
MPTLTKLETEEINSVKIRPISKFTDLLGKVSTQGKCSILPENCVKSQNLRKLGTSRKKLEISEMRVIV